MEEKLLGKAQMTLFVQTLYGVVLGVSLSDLEVDWTTMWEVSGPKPVSQRFQFFFILFTTAIAAHDWFVYHRKRESDSEKFLPHVPQIGALFFIALMFNYSEYGHLREWYLAGLGYTIFNIWSRLARKEPKWKGKRVPSDIKYLIHLAITICVGFNCFKNLFDIESIYYTVVLIVTVIVVVALWIKFDKSEFDSKDTAVTASLFEIELDSFTQTGPAKFIYSKKLEQIDNIIKFKIAELAANKKEEVLAYFEEKQIVVKDDTIYKGIADYYDDLSTKIQTDRTNLLITEKNNLKKQI